MQDNCLDNSDNEQTCINNCQDQSKNLPTQDFLPQTDYDAKHKNQPHSSDQQNESFIKNSQFNRKRPRKTSHSHQQQIAKYLQFFNLQNSIIGEKHICLLPTFTITQLIQKLQQNQIVWKGNSYKKTSKPHTDHQNLKFEILSINNNMSPQIFQIKVRLGNFYLTILVFEEFNPLDQENYSENNFFAIGSFGKIYLYQSFLSQNANSNLDYAIKSLQIKKNNQFINIFFASLKQYSFSLIMSALEIGPKINRNWGFDIIVKEDKIQFLMEFCGSYEVRKNHMQKMTEDLKKNLQIMHHFHMIHHDIKPENIAFSHFFRKWIFIDFGLSKVIEQQLGEKSMVKFLGTYQYTTDQMRKTFFKKGPVNLYWNDLFGYKETIRYISELEKRNEKQVNENIQVEEIIFENHKIIDDSISWSNKSNGDNVQIDRIPLNQKKLNQEIKINKNPYELLYLFKYSVYIKNQLRIKEIWPHISNYFSLQSEKKSLQKWLKYQQFIQNILLFLDKCPLINFVQTIYKLISDKSSQSFQLQQKIQTKIFKSPINPYLIKPYSEINDQQKKSRIIIVIQNQTSKNSQNLIKISQFYNFKNQKEIRNILLLKTKLLKTQEYFELFFNYITFRKRMFNCSFQEKILVTQVFISNIIKDNDNQIGLIDFQKKRKSISKGRSLILNALSYLITYCDQTASSLFRLKYFPQFVAQFVFINPLILAEDNLNRNYELQFVKIAIRISSGLTSFLMLCFKIMEAFKFLHYKNQHTYVSYFEKENYFGNYLYLYLTEKKVFFDNKNDFSFLIHHKDQRVQLQIDQKFANQNVWDIKQGIRLFQLLEQLVHSNWVEQNNFHLKDYNYFKTKYLQFKLLCQQITSLSYQERQCLQECLRAKYIKLVLVTSTLPSSEQEQLLIEFRKYKRQNNLTIKLFEITQKFSEERDIRNYSAIMQKIDYLINCSQISNQYLINHRNYLNFSNGRVECCISQAKLMVQNLKIHFFGMFYLCDIIRFFKPLKSWYYRVTPITNLRKQIQVLEYHLFRKVVKILNLFIRYIQNEEQTQFDSIRGRMQLHRCKKEVFNLFNHLDLTFRFQDKQQQKQFYELYQKYYQGYANELIQHKYKALKKIEQQGYSSNQALQVKLSQIKTSQLRLAHYSYRIKLQTYQYNEFLQKFNHYNDIFYTQTDYEFQFLINYLKVLRYKKMNVLNTIYRGTSNNFLQYCQLDDKKYFTYRPQQTKSIMKNCKYAIEKLTHYLIKQMTFFKFAFHLQILHYIIIHLWDFYNDIFFQYMIEKQSFWIFSDQTVHFDQAYYFAIDLIGNIIMPFQPKRSYFVQAFVQYALKNLQLKLKTLREEKILSRARNIVFYEVFVLLQITSFFSNKELYENVGFIIKLLKVAVLSLDYQTNFSRSLSKNLIYIIYYNMINEMELIKKMWQISVIFGHSKMISKIYRNFILRKLIKHDSMKKYFFTQDCPAIVKNCLQLKSKQTESDQIILIKSKINNKIHHILEIMRQDPSYHVLTNSETI